MLRVSIPTFVLSVLVPAFCFALGADHKPGDLPLHGGWPDGVHDAVNQPHRVHGFWVNSSDTLFYKGSNAELQTMVEKLTKTKGTQTKIILHVDNGIAKSPWSKKQVDTADWSVTIHSEKAFAEKQNVFTIHVWLGGNLQLDKLNLPATVDIKSAGEIEAFIKRHKESR